MKKLGIAAAIVLVAAAGWSGLWFYGRTAVAERIDREIVQLGKKGIEVTHTAREIGGFPFAYRVTHREVNVRETDSGAVYILPEVVTEVSASDINRMVTHFPPKYTIELPLDETKRAGLPGMPELLRIDVESEDLVMTTTGLPGAGQEISIVSPSLLVVTGNPEQPLSFAIEFVSIDATMKLPEAGAEPITSSRTAAERVDYVYKLATPEAPSVSVEGSVEKLSAVSYSNIRNQDALISMLADGKGTANMTYQTGASDTIVRVGEGPRSARADLKVTAGSTAGTFSLTDGVFDLAASSKANRFAVLAPAEAGAPPSELFGANIRAIETRIATPFAARKTAAPVILRFAIDQAAPDDTLWQLIDAGGKLPHDPLQLVIDIEGSGRITGDLTKHSRIKAAPFEVGNMSIRSADLNAIGASITTRGEVAFVQPDNQPSGTVTVTMTKVTELVVKLVDAGLIDPATAQTLMLIAAGFTSPGSKPDELVSKIALSPNGITVNGQPMSGN